MNRNWIPVERLWVDLGPGVVSVEVPLPDGRVVTFWNTSLRAAESK